MGEIAEKRNGCDLEEEQSCAKKATIVKPLPIRASINVSFGAPGSSFKPWKRPSSTNYIDVVAVEKNSITTNKAHNNSPLDAENENMQNNMENSTPIASGYVDKTDEGQINQPSLECSFRSETDARLKRILSNRLSAQKSRLKKNAYVADLESKEKYFKDHISFLYRQMTAQKNRSQLLQIEQHQLKLRMAACEKQRVLDEANIEKNIAELERLKEVQMRKLAAEAQAGPSRMDNSMGASLQLKSNSNLDNQPPLLNFL